MTIRTKYNGGPTKLLSCVHETESKSAVSVPGHQKRELERVTVVSSLLANLSIVCGLQRLSKIVNNDFAICQPSYSINLLNTSALMILSLWTDTIFNLICYSFIKILMFSERFCRLTSLLPFLQITEGAK